MVSTRGMKRKATEAGQQEPQLPLPPLRRKKVAAIPPPLPPLLRLPAELRNAIFEDVLDSEVPDRIALNKFEQPAITKVNKQIRSESLSLLGGYINNRPWTVTMTFCGQLKHSEELGLCTLQALADSSVLLWLRKHCYDSITDKEVVFDISHVFGLSGPPNHAMQRRDRPNYPRDHPIWWRVPSYARFSVSSTATEPDRKKWQVEKNEQLHVAGACIWLNAQLRGRGSDKPLSISDVHDLAYRWHVVRLHLEKQFTSFAPGLTFAGEPEWSKMFDDRSKRRIRKRVRKWWCPENTNIKSLMKKVQRENFDYQGLLRKQQNFNAFLDYQWIHPASRFYSPNHRS